ncbi:MAG TPA: hypothetical protein VK752_20635 [Bryobacteraceae bacterium]|nr:hypothetical protein [Bryobacteraceae bacterium]
MAAIPFQGIAKGAMAEPPSSDQVQRRIRAALLEVHSKRLAGVKPLECLREAYEVCAKVFDDAKQLTDGLLTERIPAIVFDAAVDHRWVGYPPRRTVGGLLTVMSFRKDVRYSSRYVDIPQKELTETFGSHKVPAGYAAQFKKYYLGSPIAHWQAVVMMRAAASDSMDGDMGANTLATLTVQSETVSRAGADPVATERDALLTRFKTKAMEHGIKVTHEMVAKAAKPGKWNTRTMVTWWKANDPRCKPTHDKRIRAVLDKDPATLWPNKVKISPANTANTAS